MKFLSRIICDGTSLIVIRQLLSNASGNRHFTGAVCCLPVCFVIRFTAVADHIHATNYFMGSICRQCLNLSVVISDFSIRNDAGSLFCEHSMLFIVSELTTTDDYCVSDSSSINKKLSLFSRRSFKSGNHCYNNS
jgi:hypothetical protein